MWRGDINKATQSVRCWQMIWRKLWGRSGHDREELVFQTECSEGAGAEVLKAIRNRIGSKEGTAKESALSESVSSMMFSLGQRGLNSSCIEFVASIPPHGK